jgi:GAF domain-containing protein
MARRVQEEASGADLAVAAVVGDGQRLAALRSVRLADTLPEEAFDRLTRLASDLLGVPVALTSFVEADRQVFKSCVGLPEPWSRERETPLSHSFCQYVVARREPLIVEDARTVSFLADNLAIRDLGVIAYAGYPLFGPGGQPLGSFCAIDDRPRAWSERDLSILSDLAAFAQTHIDLRVAGLAAARVAKVFERLQAITDAALSTVELDDLLARVMEDAASAFDAEAAVVDLLDDEGSLRRRAATGLPEDVKDPALPLGTGFAGRVAAARRPLQVPDAATIADLRPSLRAGGLRSLVGAPLIARGELLGTIVLGARRHDAWSDDDALTLGLAGERLALAVANANLFAREQRVARELQRALSPTVLPEVARLRLCGRYVSAEHRIGGDWFDAFALPGGRLGVAIGDVVGHGVRAASIAVRLRHHLRGFVLEGHRPGAAVALVDRIADADHELLGSTLLYAELDPASGTLQWASAGHMPPVLGREGQMVPLAPTGGTPLGVHPHDPWPERSEPLAVGDRLVVYTDGVVERRDQRSIDEGIAGLCAAAAQHRDADDLCDALLARAATEDDRAVVVVDVT